MLFFIIIQNPDLSLFISLVRLVWAVNSPPLFIIIINFLFIIIYHLIFIPLILFI